MIRKLLLFMLATSAFAAGTVQQTASKLGNTDNWVVAFQWTGDSGTGSVPVTNATGIAQLQGYLITAVETTPGSPAPSSGYSLAVKDPSGFDILAGAAVSLSATVPESFAASTAAPPLQGTFSVTITGNAVASARGSVFVFLSKPGSTASSRFAISGATAVAHKWINSISPVGLATKTQPSWIDLNQTPFLLAAEYQFTQTPNVSLTGGVQATVSMAPCPLGVNGSDTAHYYYISGGTGTAEAVLGTAGSCISGATSGTLIFTPANSHTGLWTITANWGGVQEALNVGGANATVDCGSASFSIYAPLSIQSDNVTLKGHCKASGSPPNGSSHILIAGVSNTTIDGLWLYNPAATVSAYNLIFVGANAINTNVRNCKLTGATSTNAIQANALGIAGLHITNNTISGLLYGLLVNSTATDISDVLFDNNRVTGIYADGVELNVFTGAGYTTARNFSITNNYFGDFLGDNTNPASGFCVGISGPSNVLVEGNQMHNCRIQGIHIESGTSQIQGARNVVVNGNVISGLQSGIPSLNTGIWSLNCQYCVFTSNTITGAVGWAIEMAFNGTEESRDVTIEGNIGRGNGSASTGCINFSSASVVESRVTIANNDCSNNTGDGIRLTSAPKAVIGYGNTLVGNSRFGLHIVGNPTLLSWSNNDQHGNTLGPDNFSGVLGAAHPLRDSRTTGTIAVAGTGTSDPFDCAQLGKSATGTLSVRAWNSVLASTQWITALWNISWNASSLSGGTPLNLVSSGALTSIDLAMPSFTVTDATNATPIVLTFSANHFLTDRTIVNVASVGGNTNANGNYYAKTTAVNKIALYTDPDLTVGRAGNSAYTSGGTTKSEKLQCTVTQFGGSAATALSDIQFVGTVLTNGIGQ